MPGKIYKQAKIMGFVLYIPIVLGMGPLSGYLVGDYLSERFSWGSYAIIAGVAVGILFSVFEVIRVIRIVLKIDRQDKEG